MDALFGKPCSCGWQIVSIIPRDLQKSLRPPSTAMASAQPSRELFIPSLKIPIIWLVNRSHVTQAHQNFLRFTQFIIILYVLFPVDSIPTNIRCISCATPASNTAEQSNLRPARSSASLWAQWTSASPRCALIGCQGSADRQPKHAVSGRFLRTISSKVLNETSQKTFCDITCQIEPLQIIHIALGIPDISKRISHAEHCHGGNGVTWPLPWCACV